jgi:predicted transcriptional regulator
VCYLDDILIYLTNWKEHKEDVQNVSEPLPELDLYCEAEKCQCGVAKVGILVFVLNWEGIGMESDRISTIVDWLTP